MVASQEETKFLSAAREPIPFERSGIGAAKSIKTIEKFGGREGIRTPDPLLAKQVLSQLSYTPAAQLFHSKLFSGAVHLF